MDARSARIKAYYSIPFEEYQMDFHRHPQLEIMYVCSGSCRVAAQGEDYRLKPGQLIFLQGGVYHRLLIQKGCPCHVINVEFTLDAGEGGIPLDAFFDGYCREEELTARPCAVCYDSFRLGFALKDLLWELDLGGNPYAVQILFHRTLIELARCLQQKDMPSGLQYTQKAAEFIRENFDRQLSVKEVASHVRINEAYLQTLFKKNMGCSIVSYMNGLRIQKAQFLLKNTSMDITEVAFAVGFNSRQHFGYSFKKSCGCSPLSYRKESNRDIHIFTDPFSVKPAGERRRNALK